MLWNLFFNFGGLLTNYICKKADINLFSFKAIPVILIAFVVLTIIKRLITRKF